MYTKQLPLKKQTIFRPPKFDFEAALEKRRLKQTRRILKQRKRLQAHVKPSIDAIHTTDSVVQESTTPTEKTVEEFQDTTEEFPNLKDYVEEYEQASGEMTDEDYF